MKFTFSLYSKDFDYLNREALKHCAWSCFLLQLCGVSHLRYVLEPRISSTLELNFFLHNTLIRNHTTISPTGCTDIPLDVTLSSRVTSLLQPPSHFRMERGTETQTETPEAEIHANPRSSCSSSR